MGGRLGCQRSTAHPRARAHLHLRGLVTPSTPALGPSALLGLLTEPTPGAEVAGELSPRWRWSSFGLTLVSHASCPAPAGLALQTPLDAPLGKSRGPSPGRHGLLGPGRTWATVGGAECPRGPRDSHQAGGFGSHFLPQLPLQGQDI